MTSANGKAVHGFLQYAESAISTLERDIARFQNAGKMRLDGAELIADCSQLIGKFELAKSIINAATHPTDLPEAIFENIRTALKEDWLAVREKIQLSDSYA